MGHPSAIDAVVGVLVARLKPESKPKILNPKSLSTVLDTLQKLGIHYSIVNRVIIPVFKNKEEMSRCKEVLKTRGVMVS